MATTAEIKIQTLLRMGIPDIVTVIISNDKHIAVVTRSEEDANKVSRLFGVAKLREIEVKERLDCFEGKNFWQTNAAITPGELEHLERAA